MLIFSEGWLQKVFVGFVLTDVWLHKWLHWVMKSMGNQCVWSYFVVVRIMGYVQMYMSYQYECPPGYSELVSCSAYAFLLFFFFFLCGMHSAKRRHQSPEWTILSHSYRLIQWEIVRPQVLLDSLHPCSTRTSWWSPVLRRGRSYDIPGICLVWHSCSEAEQRKTLCLDNSRQAWLPGCSYLLLLFMISDLFFHSANIVSQGVMSAVCSSAAFCLNDWWVCLLAGCVCACPVSDWSNVWTSVLSWLLARISHHQDNGRRGLPGTSRLVCNVL